MWTPVSSTDPGSASWGYSRGAQISQEALVHSGAFRAASAGEGGSPVLMPAFGPPAVRINGPLLEQMGPAAGADSLSIHRFVRSRNVPAELVVFPDETHIFHQPRHRAAAMSQNVDWFDYWLLDRRDPAASKREQYERWDALRRAWQGVTGPAR